jgi:predicted methyltransferase
MIAAVAATPTSFFPQTLGAWAAIIAGIVSTAGVIIGWRNSHGLRQTKSEVRKVHRAVNSTAMKQNQRTDQLTAALTEAGIPVPARLPDTDLELNPEKGP